MSEDINKTKQFAIGDFVTTKSHIMSAVVDKRGPSFSMVNAVYEKVTGFTYSVEGLTPNMTAGGLVRQEDAKEFAMHSLMERLKEVMLWK